MVFLSKKFWSFWNAVKENSKFDLPGLWSHLIRSAKVKTAHFNGSSKELTNIPNSNFFGKQKSVTELYIKTRAFFLLHVYLFIKASIFKKNWLSLIFPELKWAPLSAPVRSSTHLIPLHITKLTFSVNSSPSPFAINKSHQMKFSLDIFCSVNLSSLPSQYNWWWWCQLCFIRHICHPPNMLVVTILFTGNFSSIRPVDVPTANGPAQWLIVPLFEILN